MDVVRIAFVTKEIADRSCNAQERSGAVVREKFARPFADNKRVIRSGGCGHVGNGIARIDAALIFVQYSGELNVIVEPQMWNADSAAVGLIQFVDGLGLPVVGNGQYPFAGLLSLEVVGEPTGNGESSVEVRPVLAGGNQVREIGDDVLRRRGLR